MAAKTRECPIHWVPLVPEKVSVRWAPDVTVDRCPDCQGVFLDKGEIKRVTGHGNLHTLLTKHLGVDSDSRRVCPSCGGVMDAEDAGGIHVDVCLTCNGVWLDGGELEALQGKDRKEFDPDSYSAEKWKEIEKAENLRAAERKRAFQGLLGGLGRKRR